MEANVTDSVPSMLVEINSHVAGTFSEGFFLLSMLLPFLYCQIYWKFDIITFTSDF